MLKKEGKEVSEILQKAKDHIETALAKHIKNILKNHRYDKMTVKIFHDYVAFLSRAEGMNNIAAVDKPNSRKKEREIKNIILSISM